MSQNQFLPLHKSGSVKRIFGPLEIEHKQTYLFEYTDQYSIFDWGVMPNSIPGKGNALNMISAFFFQMMSKPEEWKKFQSSEVAHFTKKNGKLGADFLETLEKLSTQGLKHHWLGTVVGEPSLQKIEIQKDVLHGKESARSLVKKVDVIHPKKTKFCGENRYDYADSALIKKNKLIPLEVVFRFQAKEGSSYLERNPKHDPEKIFYPACIEFFSKLETTDRYLSLEEALYVSSLPLKKIEELIFQTQWIASFLRNFFSQKEIELVDGKLEWSLDETGELMLVDAIGLDEIRILSGGVDLSKEFLRKIYRKSPWAQKMFEIKKEFQGHLPHDWKKHVPLQPQILTDSQLQTASKMYEITKNVILSKETPSAIRELVSEMKKEMEE